MDRCLADPPGDARLPSHALRLTSRICLALPRPIDEAALRRELIALADRQVVVARGDASALVDDLTALALRVLHDDASLDHAFASRLLTACSMHRAVVGRSVALFDTLERIAASADRETDPRARFGAYRIAFACELARGDLKKACEHAERAYRAARAVQRVACRFESLLLVVQLLETMGLWRDARDLALNLVRWRTADEALDVLHIANAVHGLRACRRLDDVEGAGRFHAMLCELEASAMPADAMTSTMVAVAKAAHHTWIGKPRAALRAVEIALARPAAHDDPRALALALCAEADIRLAGEDAVGILTSTVALTALLDRTDARSSLHRPLLRMLVRLALRSEERHGASAGEAALARYREPADTGPGASLPIDFLWWTAADREVLPMSVRPDDDACADHEPSLSEIGFDFDDFVARGSDLCAAESEAALRTPHFDIVESWAIAAEIAAGGNGRQCFKVGRVAAALGAALGFSDERCVVLEMGCRVRDLGRAAVDCVPGSDGLRVDDSWIDAERARAADRMLSFSSDPVLVVAARIAGHRHAWWNGSGFPAAQRGEEIPIEARICAVADALVAMVDPLDRRRRWSIEQASRQVACLGGVRFDPSLVEVLDGVLRYRRPDAVDVAQRRRTVSADDSLAKAQKYLLESLELVD